ncbi:hypothetical protein C7974DRAFT_392704 [Boeremia exigua]|uniref:uncharacterized protein n=1 Tax=Boeremia exigua TaxID=749465 RepID=UPI001E8CFC27|nr:uncharacterized protein C7974DRAFT_392704 [Boeremia exigua]KAH6633395.1 hypothetical protein C7974DRAFT_392704 [Boeremia exigua]
MYHPSVKEVESLSSQLISEFQYYITNSTYKDDETDYLLEESKVLEHPPHESHVLRIALIGDAGQGKSSLLNSMLGQENLAIHAADGNSCTYVVVEYAQAFATQSHPFQAKVEFLSRQTCRDLVKEQLKNFWLFITTDMEAELDEEIVNERRLGAITCISVFSSLFIGHAEFSDRDSAETFLSDAESAHNPRLVSKLMSWTDEILDAFMTNEDNVDVATINANTASQISDAIQPFTMVVEDPHFDGTDIVCCPWPLVKMVVVSLSSRILEQGIIIADLPGTTDKIRSRVDSAKRYLQSCDMTIVVNNMARAIDHAALHNHVNEAFRRKRSGNTIVVCTRSDDLQVTAKQSFPSIPAEEKAMAEIAEKEATVKKHLMDLALALSSPQFKKKPFEKFKLVQKKERFMREKNELARQRYEVRVSARNRHVKHGVTEQYRQDTKDRSPLPIFCVSNVIYMQHLSGGYPKSAPPQLRLEATEIPALRTHLFSQPSLGRFQSLEHYCKSLLPAFFNTIEISCSVSKLKRKDELNRTFNKSQSSLKETIEDATELLTEHKFGLVYRIIDKQEMAWINRARRKCNKWSQFKPAGYAAVLRHDGKWSTKTIDPQNWNEDLLKSVDDDLSPIFDEIHDQDCNELAADIAERVGDAVEKLNNALRVDPAAALSGAITAFRANLKERRSQIDKICEAFRKQLKNEIRRIQTRTTTNDTDHYFTAAMQPIYAAAVHTPKVRGRRLHDLRAHALLTGVTAEDGPYRALATHIRAAYDAVFQHATADLWTQLNEVFERTRHDVNLVCST